MLREFCAENLTCVAAAIEAGAGRIELCDNLAVGGTTPSYEVLKAGVALCRDKGAALMCMVRPRGGDFEYTAGEAAMMRDDLLMAKRLGVTGVVFGCTRGERLDKSLTGELVDLAHEPCDEAPHGTQVTFHMAFDVLDEHEQLSAIDWLAERGVERILTHGGPAGTPIEGNAGRLRAYVERADGRLAILPGGGITWQNAGQVAALLGVDEVHGTKVVRF